MPYWAPLSDSVIVVLIGLFLLRCHTKLRFTHPAVVFLLYHIVTVSVRLWTLWGGANFSFDFLYLPAASEYLRAFFISDLGFLATLAGLFIFSGGNRESEVRTALCLRFDKRVVIGMAAVLIPVSLISSFYYENLGVNSNVVQEVTVVDGRNVDVNGYAPSPILWLMPTLILLVYYFGLKKPLVAVLLLALAGRMYLASNRFAYLLPALMFVAVIIELQRRRWPTARQMLLILSSFFVFSAGKGIVRSVAENGLDEDTIGNAITNFENNLSGRGEVAFFDQSVLVATTVPERANFLVGRYYYVPFLMWVPRIYWPEKPGLNDDLREIGAASGLPLDVMGTVMTMHGANYVNFGYPGVIVLGFVTGAVLMLLYNWAYSSGHGSVQLLIYIAGWATFFQFFRDGWMPEPLTLFNTGFPIYLAGVITAISATAVSSVERWLR